MYLQLLFRLTHSQSFARIACLLTATKELVSWDLPTQQLSSLGIFHPPAWVETHRKPGVIRLNSSYPFEKIMDACRMRARSFAKRCFSDRPVTSSVSLERKRLDVSSRERTDLSQSSSLDQSVMAPLWRHDPDAIYSGKDQVIYPAGPEEIEIFTNNKNLFNDPQRVENSIVIRIIALADPVTSPIKRVFRNRQFGIRNDEGYHILSTGLCISFFFCSLGFWQLRRMEFKRKTIELRRHQMTQPMITCNASPFPWASTIAEFEHREIQVRGVFDNRREILIGPRAISFIKDSSSAMPDSVGYLVITPLILEDGSQLLVNRGYISFRDATSRDFESPEWVTVRGVLSCGELPGGREWWRLPNNVASKKFIYADPGELATAANITRNFQEASQAYLVAFETIYSSGDKKSVFKSKNKGDILAVYGDEHTHLWYAVQWFLSAGLLTSMTLYRWLTYFRKYRF
jgi:cytochrome oxidase assembly protein ShyY1